MDEQLDLFGKQKLHEYFITISPDQRTSERVKLSKMAFNNLIALSQENLWSVPHLSLFRFQAPFNSDEAVIRKMNRVLAGAGSFKVEVGGLDVLDHGNVKKTIVYKIRDAEKIKSLQSSISKEFRYRSPSKFTPHITIARNIPMPDFNRLVHSLKHFDYKGEFMCHKITVLKKVLGESKTYSLFYEAKLN